MNLETIRKIYKENYWSLHISLALTLAALVGVLSNSVTSMAIMFWAVIAALILDDFLEKKRKKKEPIKPIPINNSTGTWA